MLPEGLEVSNLFYYWLSSTLDRYLGDKHATMEEREIFRENAFGISLSATGLTEVRMEIPLIRATVSMERFAIWYVSGSSA